MTFEHCVVVRESTRTDERPNSPKYRKAYSIYAPNIGRIYRYFRVIDKTAAGGKIDETTSGVHVETLVEHN
jgi:hypothetical protein